MRRVAAILLAVLVCVGCVARADGDAVLLTEPWLHGRTEPPTAGVVVTAGRYSSTTNQSGAWGVTAAEVGTGRVTTIHAVAPEGWTVQRISHPLGSAAGNVLQVTIPNAPSLGPDVVVYLRSVEAPVATATPTYVEPPTPPQIPTFTPTATRAWPTDEPTRTPTAVTPTATAPAGGYVVWDNPPADLVTALAYEVDWLLAQFEPTDDPDPLWLAAASRGPVWGIGLPMQTRISMEGVEYALRWQVFLTPKGWRLVFATPDQPYRVAVIEGEGW